MNISLTTNSSLQTEQVNVLSIIIDTNPWIWGRRALESNNYSFSTFMQHLFVFIHSYLLSKPQNRLSVIASHYRESRFLYPVPIHNNQEEDKKKKKKKKKDENSLFSKENSFQNVQEQILENLKQLSNCTEPSNDISKDTPNDKRDDDTRGGSSISSALSHALCFINRMENEKPPGTQLHSRILCIQSSHDVSAQYISVMNAIFSAQRMDVAIDALVLNSEDSSFLQQAAYITGGVYMKPKRQEGLVQYLLSVYLVEKEMRKMIQLPIQSTIDFRASCFETKKTIDNGFVCSVCLSIFSKQSPICSTCKTKLKIFRK